MDVPKQIEYWTKGSQEDLDAARDLLAKKHFRHGLFFAHLAVEKKC
jgi:HEPN domain-containing protein